MYLTAPLSQVIQDLEARRFFKLICGGSFSDSERLSGLIQAYAHAGASMIDISAAKTVVDIAAESLAKMQAPPVLMVSFPLDEDPHFRKIQLTKADCIDCAACLPVCPTDVFDMTDHLTVNTPACYGCGRCVPICPTQALFLAPFHVYPDLVSVLKNPAVQAVEIHTQQADPVMVPQLYAELGSLLKNKLIAVCLRPQLLPINQVVDFLTAVKHQTPYPLIVQVDGEPMSGSDDPTASLPALQAARDFAPFLPEDCYLTISGGINRHTAKYLHQSSYKTIQGVGMGTAARRWVWADLNNLQAAQEKAETMVSAFCGPGSSAIIRSMHAVDKNAKDTKHALYC